MTAPPNVVAERLPNLARPARGLEASQRRVHPGRGSSGRYAGNRPSFQISTSGRGLCDPGFDLHFRDVLHTSSLVVDTNGLSSSGGFRHKLRLESSTAHWREAPGENGVGRILTGFRANARGAVL